MEGLDTYFRLFTLEFMITGVAGALIGISINNLPKVIKFIKICFSSCPMEGEWWHYFYNFDTCDENACLKVEKVKIKRGVTSAYKIKTLPEIKTESPFIGTMEIEKGYLVVQLRAKDHTEKVFQRFIQPNQWNKPMLGVSIAHDYHGRNTSGINILSRSTLTEAEVACLVESRYMFDKKTLTTRVLV
ncbi:hypothetical protein ABMX68_21915 [Vibrio vulnificus]|uniref:hypothetical protein n=1 Tax=Vibrio vulnificus TaxID=672 RepID=UPI0028C30ED6|nr:hypothetical protein [Vibrio vulnificus]